MGELDKGVSAHGDLPLGEKRNSKDLRKDIPTVLILEDDYSQQLSLRLVVKSFFAKAGMECDIFVEDNVEGALEEVVKIMAKDMGHSFEDVETDDDELFAILDAAQEIGKKIFIISDSNVNGEKKGTDFVRALAENTTFPMENIIFNSASDDMDLPEVMDKYGIFNNGKSLKLADLNDKINGFIEKFKMITPQYSPNLRDQNDNSAQSSFNFVDPVRGNVVPLKGSQGNVVQLKDHKASIAGGSAEKVHEAAIQ